MITETVEGEVLYGKSETPKTWQFGVLERYSDASPEKAVGHVVYGQLTQMAYLATPDFLNTVLVRANTDPNGWWYLDSGGNGVPVKISHKNWFTVIEQLGLYNG